jgi:hypothetical protein
MCGRGIIPHEENHMEQTLAPNGTQMTFRSAWGPGPWLDEPEAVVFEHQGYCCVLKRHFFLGTWNGYVVVPDDHRVARLARLSPFGDPDNSIYRQGIDLKVHGGVTWYGDAPGRDGEPGVADTALLILERGFVFGFDASHALDLIPHFGATMPRQVYRTVGYMREEVIQLANQLKALETP